MCLWKTCLEMKSELKSDSPLPPVLDENVQSFWESVEGKSSWWRRTMQLVLSLPKLGEDTHKKNKIKLKKRRKRFVFRFSKTKRVWKSSAPCTRSEEHFITEVLRDFRMKVFRFHTKFKANETVEVPETLIDLLPRTLTTIAAEKENIYTDRGATVTACNHLSWKFNV